MKDRNSNTTNLNGSLLEETLRLLKQSEKSTIDIHKETGQPFHWLRKLRAGEIPNPSVNRIQALFEHLSGRKLIRKA